MFTIGIGNFLATNLREQIMKIGLTCPIVLMLCLFSGCAQEDLLKACKDAESEEQCIKEDNFHNNLACEWVKLARTDKQVCVRLEK